VVELDERLLVVDLEGLELGGFAFQTSGGRSVGRGVGINGAGRGGATVTSGAEGDGAGGAATSGARRDGVGGVATSSARRCGPGGAATCDAGKGGASGAATSGAGRGSVVATSCAERGDAAATGSKLVGKRIVTTIANGVEIMEAKKK
jgi:hypothetical protein